MRIFDQLYEASFRGVPFLIDSTASVSTSGGRKTVTHEYPNSPNRLTEDLGFLPKTFTVTGIVPDNGNYIENRDNILNALDQKGIGQFVHPFLGTRDVVSTTYTLNETPSRLGFATISMTFETQQGQLNPLGDEVTQSGVAEDQKDTNNSVKCDLLSKFDVAASSIETYNATKDKVLAISKQFDVAQKKVVNRVNQIQGQVLTTTQNIANEINACLEALGAIPQQITDSRDQVLSALAGNIQNFTDNVNTIIQAPENLVNGIQTLFDELQVVAVNTVDQFRILADFFDFGDDDVEFSETTTDLKQRADNLDSLNDNIQINSLAAAFTTAVQINFKNENELNEVQDILETQFQKIIDKPISVNTRVLLTELRNTAILFLNEQALTVAKIIDINTSLIPSNVLAYRFYGDTTRAEEIIDLNNIFSPAFIQGDIQILSE